MQHELDPDQALVTRAQGGDEAALEEIMGRYRGPVFAFAYRLLGSHAAAEDAAQNAFVKAFQTIHRFRFRSHARFSTWLFQLARNEALDELRRQRRHPTTELAELPHAPPATAPDPGQSLEHREMGEAIANAVATLPEDQRTALILTEYHGQSAEDVAQILHCTRRGAESRVFRARQAVREILTREGWS